MGTCSSFSFMQHESTVHASQSPFMLHESCKYVVRLSFIQGDSRAHVSQFPHMRTHAPPFIHPRSNLGTLPPLRPRAGRLINSSSCQEKTIDQKRPHRNHFYAGMPEKNPPANLVVPRTEKCHPAAVGLGFCPMGARNGPSVFNFIHAAV